MLRAPKLVLIAATALSVGCQAPEDAESLEFRAEKRQRIMVADDPDSGTYISNGLEDPTVSGVDPAYGLATAQGLDPDGSLLADPVSQKLARYLVECALPDDVTIAKEVDGEVLELDGLLGLAPQWEDGACDEDCQQWVSACLLARTNVSGEAVELWLRADHEAIGSGTHVSFPVYEASFFGNLFEEDGGRYICRGSLAGNTVAFLDGRTCTADLNEDCGFTKFDDCPLVGRCDYQGLLFPMGVECEAPGDVPQHAITTYIHALVGL